MWKLYALVCKSKIMSNYKIKFKKLGLCSLVSAFSHPQFLSKRALSHWFKKKYLIHFGWDHYKINEVSTYILYQCQLCSNWSYMLTEQHQLCEKDPHFHFHREKVPGETTASSGDKKQTCAYFSEVLPCCGKHSFITLGSELHVEWILSII